MSRPGIVKRKAGRGHYYLIDGKKADGVTTLIGDGLPKPALARWSANTVAEFVADNVEHMRDVYDWMDRDQLVAMLKQVPWSRRDTAAVKGTDVHALAERLTNGEEVEVPDHLAGYVESCVRFLDEWRVRPILTEAVIASRRWNYCGTLDLVGELRDGQRGIFDWKTGASGIFPEAALQLSAYAHAEVYLDGTEEKPVSPLGIERGFGVHIRPDGYDVFELPVDEKTFNAFLHVVTVARWAKASRDLVGEPASPPLVEVVA